MAESDISAWLPSTDLFWSSKMIGSVVSSGDLKSIPSIRNLPFAFHSPFARSCGWKQPVATIEVWKSSVGSHATVKSAVRSWLIDTVHVPPDALQSLLPTAVGETLSAGLTWYVPGPRMNL